MDPTKTNFHSLKTKQHTSNSLQSKSLSLSLVSIQSSMEKSSHQRPPPPPQINHNINQRFHLSDSERGRRRILSKNKEKEVAQCAPPRILALPPPSPTNQAKLAAVAVDLNVRLRSADMSPPMQERVFRHARVLLDSNSDNKRLNPTHLALCLKKEFDMLYGPAWHCIVGKSFGSFVTHSSGGFVYFSIDKLSFLLFKTEVRPVVVRKSTPPLLIKYNNSDS